MINGCHYIYGHKHATLQFQLQNKSTHKILGIITPKEAFYGRNLDVSHFQNFGATMYFHVSKDSRMKLEPTTKIAVFLRYIDTPHNYRVYVPSLSVTVVRRDVKFYEDKDMR